MSARDGLPSAMYTLQHHTDAGTRKIVLDVADAETIHLQITEPDGSHWIFHQPPTGIITANINRGGETHVCTGETWVHLYIAHRRDLPPVLWDLLDRLVPSQPVDQFFAAVDAAARQGGNLAVDPRRIDAIMEQFRSDRSGDRRDARVALARLGVPGAIAIRSMLDQDWNAEQHAAAADLCRRAERTAPDHVGSLAVRVAADPAYWSAIEVAD